MNGRNRIQLKNASGWLLLILLNNDFSTSADYIALHKMTTVNEIGKEAVMTYFKVTSQALT